MKNTLPYLVIYIAAGLIALITGLLASKVSTASALAFAVGTLLVLFSHILAKAIRINARYQDNIFRQMECLAQLNLYLQPRSPLPTTRGYRGSPDFLVEVHRLIKQHKPEVIVEASSGLSTLVAAYSLEQLGTGQVFSLENNAHYAGLSRELLEEHKVSAHAAVYHAPLTTFSIEGKNWKWYDLTQAPIPETIDMILVDGPPDRIQKYARYPALPLLINKLKPGGLLVLDDADRPTEKYIVKQWLQGNEGFELHTPHAEKGIAVLRKIPQTKK